MAVLAQLPTLMTVSLMWFDEASQIDHGRVLFSGAHTSWAFNWDPAGHALVLWTYLSEGLWYGLYRLTFPWPVGSRVASLLFAATAALLAYGWLRRMRVESLLALLLALALFLDPYFEFYYAADRPDSLAFTFMFGALWLLWAAGDNPHAARARVQLGGTAALCAAGVYVWPDVAFMYPLVLLGLVRFIRNRAFATRVQTLRFACMFGLAYGACVAILALPLLPVLPMVWRDLPVFLHRNSGLAAIGHGDGFLDSMQTNSPLILVLTTLSLLVPGNWSFKAVVVAVGLYVMSTDRFGEHAVYLLPSFVALIGLAGTNLLHRWRRSSTAVYGAVALVLLYAAGITLVHRPLLAWEAGAARSPGTLLAIARHIAPPGPHTVYIGAQEFYFPGQLQGWHMYLLPFTPYDASDSTFFRRMEYAIFTPDRVTTRLRQEMHQAGLVYERELSRAGWAPPGRRLPLVPSTYGPYTVFSRALEP